MSKMIEIKGEKVSEETIIEALKKHCGFEEKKERKKFEPIKIHGGCFVVSIDGGDIKIVTGNCFHGACFQNPTTARQFIEALQEAIDYIEKQS